MAPDYLVEKKPNTKLWFVFGFVGRSKSGRAQYMRVSDGFAAQAKAKDHIQHIKKAIAAARAEVAV